MVKGYMDCVSACMNTENTHFQNKDISYCMWCEDMIDKSMMEMFLIGKNMTGSVLDVMCVSLMM